MANHPPMPDIRDPETGMIMVWDGHLQDYVPLQDPNNNPASPSKIDTEMFNPAANPEGTLEKSKNPLAEGILSYRHEKVKYKKKVTHCHSCGYHGGWGWWGPAYCPQCNAPQPVASSSDSGSAGGDAGGDAGGATSSYQSANAGKCPECGAKGFSDHRPDCELGRYQNAYMQTPVENYTNEPFHPWENRNPMHIDDYEPTMPSKDSAADLDHCPNCQGTMVDHKGEKVCVNCHTKQPVYYAGEKLAFLPALLGLGEGALDVGALGDILAPAMHKVLKGIGTALAPLNTVDDLFIGTGGGQAGSPQPKQSGIGDILKDVAPLALLAVPGVGEVAAPAMMGAEAAGAGAEAAGSAGLMAGALNAGKGLATLPFKPGIAGGLARHEMFNALGNGAQDASQAVQDTGMSAPAMESPLPPAPDGPTSAFSNHFAFFYSDKEVSDSTSINGDDVNPENDGEWGNQNRTGDSPELLKDVNQGGGAVAIDAMSPHALKIVDYFHSDRPGSEDPHLVELHHHLTKSVKGYKQVFDALQNLINQKRSNMPLQNQQQQLPNQGMQPTQSPIPNFSMSCAVCGQSGHTAANCPQATAQPGAGMTPGGTNRMTYVERIAARRPKMCPYHSELVDYSLTLNDPMAARGTVKPADFGDTGYWHTGGEHPKCNFKPEMVTREFWDAREQAQQERAEQREQERMQPQTVEPQVEAPVDNVTEVDFNPGVSDAGLSDMGPTDESYQNDLQMAASLHHIANILETGSEERQYVSQWLKEAASWADPRGETPCPNCGSAASYENSGGHCAECGYDHLAEGQRRDQQFVENDPGMRTLLNSDPYRRAKTAAWFDKNGQELQEGGTYLMHAQGYNQPDFAKIMGIHDHKLDVVLNINGHEVRRSLSDNELAQYGFSFEPSTHTETPETSYHDNHEVEKVENDAPVGDVGDPGQTNDLSVSEDLGDPVMAKTAGKRYLPIEQREFINEPGVARNLAKLDLSGTHYDELANHFNFGL